MGAIMQGWLVMGIALFVLRADLVFGGQELQVKTERAAVIMTRAQKLVMEYQFDETPFKPYVRQLCSPGGSNVLRDQVADHLHHHGLMFAVAADGVSYWEELATAGKQKHQSINTTERGLVQKLVWQGPEEQSPSLLETRRVAVSARLVEGATLVTWYTQLETPEDHAPVKLSGAHYFGLGMRLPKSMDTVSTFLVPSGPVAGEVVRGDERLTGGDWCACTSDNAGAPVTVALFDHPTNARRALWFTMNKPFAYLCASLNLHRQPLQIQTGKPLSLRYGIAVWDGQKKADEIEKVYRHWLEMNE